MDTGVNQHSSFQNRVFRDFDYYGVGAWDTFPVQHGTHVAGIAASSIYGVATNAQIHAIRVLDSTGTGSLASLLAGFLYIQANGEPGIINLSLGMLGGYSSTVADVITNMQSAGFIFVVAAGNDNIDASIEFPANVEGVVAVGAFDSSRVKASFSNYGPTVTIWSPGVMIVSAFGNGTGSQILSGTSMATPFVTGVLALYKQYFPTWSAADLIDYLYYTTLEDDVNGLSFHSSANNNNNELFYAINPGYVPGPPAESGGAISPLDLGKSISILLCYHIVLFCLFH
jgi:subtilisin family serine protease